MVVFARQKGWGPNVIDAIVGLLVVAGGICFAFFAGKTKQKATEAARREGERANTQARIKDAVQNFDAGDGNWRDRLRERE
jgi:hypothetical protein